MPKEADFLFRTNFVSSDFGSFDTADAALVFLKIIQKFSNFHVAKKQLQFDRFSSLKRPKFTLYQHTPFANVKFISTFNEIKLNVQMSFKEHERIENIFNKIRNEKKNREKANKDFQSERTMQKFIFDHSVERNSMHIVSMSSVA